MSQTASQAHPTLRDDSDPITVGEALEELLELTAQRCRDGVRSRATLEMQTAHARWWSRQLGAETRLEDVDELDLDRLAYRPQPRRAHERPGWGPATLRKRLSTLRSAFALAHRRRRVPRVPAFPTMPWGWRPRRRYLETYAQARRLFESLPRHRAEWMWLALWTGQHASDVDRMTWSDVSLHGQTFMLIRNTKNRMVDGLRVCVPAPLLVVLREMHERDDPKPSDPIVQPWPSRNTTLKRHCRKLGLPELAAIDLRHTCLSWLVRRRGITPDACAFAGHRSPQMMARTYAHALPTQLHAAIADLESIADE